MFGDQPIYSSELHMTLKYKDPKLWLISFNASQCKDPESHKANKIGQESTPLSPRNPTSTTRMTPTNRPLGAPKRTQSVACLLQWVPPIPKGSKV